MLYAKPESIVIKEDLPRIRKQMDQAKFKSLVESLKTYGQLQPIVVNRNMELIAGGRRLAACTVAQIEVAYVFKDCVDDVLMREMEMEENLQRDDLSAAEEIEGIAELHRLKQQIHGVAVSGKVGGWTLDDTAELIGKTRGSVIGDLQLAEALQQFPELRNLPKKHDIRKAVKGLEKVADRITAIKTYEEIVATRVETVHFYHQDAMLYMPTIPDSSIDLVLTDPLFGINMDKLAMNVGGLTGGELTTSGISLEDDPDVALKVLAHIAQESMRFTKDTAHLYCFIGPEHFWTVRNMFMACGWLVHVKPLIWIKNAGGQCNVPHAWPSSAYEMILFARRASSRLVVEGRPDWIQCDPVLQSQRLHPWEKPIPLLKDLIIRTSMPGQKMYDPCMGSGASLEAGLEMKMIVSGTDIDVDCYRATSERIAKYTNNHNVKI
jgi:DNA modification methylase